MKYMMEKAAHITWLHLYAANLITNDVWTQYFTERGEHLEVLQLDDLDTYFENEQLDNLVEFCPTLNRLKLKRCRRLTPDCLNSIAKLQNLEHLSLQFSTGVSTANDILTNLITTIGPNLRTLSLEDFNDADNDIISTIASSCINLQKFRLCSNDTITDAAWANLFAVWENPPLTFADFSRTRDVDNSCPDGPTEEPIGFGALGFTAMMAHSGPELQYLNIASCRHIAYSALCEVFDGVEQYPELLEVDLSFVTNVDTLVLAGLFKSAPKLRKVVAFGCFAIEDVVVPHGVVVIGVPRAQDAIERFGEAGVDVEDALGGMLEKATLGIEVGA